MHLCLLDWNGIPAWVVRCTFVWVVKATHKYIGLCTSYWMKVPADKHTGTTLTIFKAFQLAFTIEALFFTFYWGLCSWPLFIEGCCAEGLNFVGAVIFCFLSDTKQILHEAPRVCQSNWRQGQECYYLTIWLSKTPSVFLVWCHEGLSRYFEDEYTFDNCCNVFYVSLFIEVMG